MRGKGFIRTCVCIVAALVCALQARAENPSSAQDPPARISLLMATGLPGSTYYQAGLGMASLWTTRLKGPGIRVSAAASEGSLENIEAIRIGDADLILAEDMFASAASRGVWVFKGRPATELRAIAMLWPDVLHYVLRADRVQSGEIKDLERSVLAVGLPDSGSRLIAEYLLRKASIDFKAQHRRAMSPSAALEAFRKGQVQGLEMVGCAPIPMLLSLFTEGKPKSALLQVRRPESASPEETQTQITRVLIPANTYPGQTKNVHTLGQMSVLCVAASLDSQVVYALTKTMFENLDHLAKAHPCCRHVSADRATEGLSIPLHRGALRYFREKKIKVPETAGAH